MLISVRITQQVVFEQHTQNGALATTFLFDNHILICNASRESTETKSTVSKVIETLSLRLLYILLSEVLKETMRLLK